MYNRKKRILKWIAAGTLAGMLLLISGIGSKKIMINQYLSMKYPVKGIDVSHYQGEIDWGVLSQNQIDFAFIKATEGSKHIDSEYSRNIANAKKTELLIGAYHFFSFDSSAETQAANFIAAVPKEKGMLAPLIDIEFYEDKKKNRPDPELTRAQLTILLEMLEDYYGIKPIIYTTFSAYQEYIKGSYDEYPLFIRNVYYSPDFDINGEWTFWQYSDTSQLSGYKGSEKYIDMDVFCGTREELEQYVIH